MIKPEILQEGWVKFSRYHCTEGYIDIWLGDSSDNPNRDIKSHWYLNSFNTYIRLNGEGRWFPNGYRKGVKRFTSEMGVVTTSQEIWDELKKHIYED